MKVIDVGNLFYHRLANRNEHQGDGKYTAISFRNRFLKELENEENWKSDEPFICFDFINVHKIGPSFANEAFGYFAKWHKPKDILKKIIFKNISRIQRLIIENELKTSYEGRSTDTQF